jgi:hypothetical protein
MRKLLSPLLVLLLLSLLTAAASAQALSVPGLPDDPLGAIEDEAEEPETEESDEPEAEELGCTIEDEEDAQLCPEIAEEERESEEAEECVLEDATAKVAPRPGDSSVQLTIHYEAFAPAAVSIDARLRGRQGRLHLGSRHTHFRRAGVYRDSFALSEKQMERALTAHEFTVELKAVNTPRYCRFDLTGAPRPAKRSLRAGGPGRSGDRGRTHGKSGRDRLR